MYIYEHTIAFKCRMCAIRLLIVLSYSARRKHHNYYNKALIINKITPLHLLKLLCK
jgi:hypothetical protein